MARSSKPVLEINNFWWSPISSQLLKSLAERMTWREITQAAGLVTLFDELKLQQVRVNKPEQVAIFAQRHICSVCSSLVKYRDDG